MEFPTLFNVSLPISRKEHRCCECGATIKAKEQYQRIEGLWEGDFEVYKICWACRDVRSIADDLLADDHHDPESHPALSQLHQWLANQEEDAVLEAGLVRDDKGIYRVAQLG